MKRSRLDLLPMMLLCAVALLAIDDSMNPMLVQLLWTIDQGEYRYVAKASPKT